MQVFLEAIKFNHDPTSASCDAINIRRNETEFVTVPEWRRGVSIRPEDSPAVYSIESTRSQQITIKAKFKCLDPKIESIEVRAIDPARDLYASPTTGNALGEVGVHEIAFDQNGESEFEVLNLCHVDIWRRGVSASVTRWRWQCRLRDSDGWSDLVITTHKIYTVLTL